MKKLAKIFLCLSLALMMSLSLAVPAFANYCAHDFDSSVTVWYTDKNESKHTEHKRITIRCKKCNYKDSEKVYTRELNHRASRYTFTSSNHSSANPADHYCIKKLLCEKCPRAFTSDRVSTGCTASGCHDYQRIDPVPVTE